jgi:hypothetical protein
MGRLVLLCGFVIAGCCRGLLILIFLLTAKSVALLHIVGGEVVDDFHRLWPESGFS